MDYLGREAIPAVADFSRPGEMMTRRKDREPPIGVTMPVERFLPAARDAGIFTSGMIAAEGVRMKRLPLAAVLAAGLAGAALADPVEDFFRGKSVNLAIGYSAGGGYDLYGRLLARHLGKQIPGKPAIVAQNMPGAGSLKAAAWLASVAPRDGTALATFSRAMPFYPLLFSPDFEATGLGYIGSITTDTSVCITWHGSAIREWKDLVTKPSAFGGEGKGSDPDVFATLLRVVWGANVKLVSGYPGTADMTLAMERGEIDGFCGISWSTLKSAHVDWLREKKINIVVQAAKQKDPALPDTPLLLDLATDARQRQVVSLAVAPQAMARPFAAPPGLPADRLAALRLAFDRTMKDADFLADAAKVGLDVNPLGGAEIGEMVRKLYQTPRDIVLETSRAMGQ